MKAIFQKLLGMNWRTTSAAIIAIAGLAVNIQVAWKAKDFMAIVNNSQMIMLNLGLIAAALGFASAKDSNVNGVGQQAVTVDSTGAVTNIAGEPLGKQSAVPPSKGDL
jgi:hypothetical protein